MKLGSSFVLIHQKENLSFWDDLREGHPWWKKKRKKEKEKNWYLQ